MKIKIPFLTRLLEIKELQLKIEATKIFILDKIANFILPKNDYNLLTYELNEIWEENDRK